MLVQSSNSTLHSRLTTSRWTQVLDRLRLAELLALIVGVLSMLVHAGFVGVSDQRVRELGWGVLLVMGLIAVSRAIRFGIVVSPRRLVGSLFEANLILPLVWLAGLGILLYGGLLTEARGVVWAEIAITGFAIARVLGACRVLATRTQNSAVLLVGSFLVVITVGTLLLKLPACRAADANGVYSGSADWNVALFTATSASCVTGLVVEPTGSYWSPTGHAVIFALFQIGGLGILTFGAFLAVLSGRNGLQFREARTLRDMLDAQSVHGSRRLLVTILLFTFCVEALGAFSLIGLWPDRPFPERVWQATFHSVSAFCNAGFSLNDDGFLDMGTRWQVWGPLTWLIILGGLGFPVIHDLWSSFRRRFHRPSVTPLFPNMGKKTRFSVHTKLVLWSTLFLLLGGAVFWFALESFEAPPGSSTSKRFADAWFQSVTFRTAGFNTVDHESMNPATKLMAIFLMFVGAAPGSTGGGVKTVVFAIMMLSIWAVFRGRDRVEIWGRCIPTSQVSRSLSMIGIGVFIVLITTGLLVVFERQPHRFLDHLYEATSAFGTVGVSANITAGLSLPSRLLICAVMFLGRVGPITLLLAMVTPSESCRYDYPVERVSLG
jgi:trk system potassium uptake protein